MLPYLIAGAIGFGIGKLFENGGETFMAGGRITTNEDVLNSFLTSTKEVKVNNLSTHFNEYENLLLLRNYGTIIAGRYVNTAEKDYRYGTLNFCYVTKTKYSQTTTKILNKLKALATKMGYTITDACTFDDGGEMFMAGGRTNEDIIFEYPKDSNGRIMSWINVGTGNMEIASKTGTVGQVRDGHQLIVLKSETPNKVDYHILVDYLPEENKINMVRGKFNSEPSPKYQSYINDLFRMLKISQTTRDYQDEDIANQVYVKQYLINNFGNPPKGCQIKATELGVEIHFDSTNKMSSDWAMKIADKYGYPSGNFEMRYSSGNVPITYVDISKLNKNTSKSEKGYFNFGETFMAGGNTGVNIEEGDSVIMYFNQDTELEIFDSEDFELEEPNSDIFKKGEEFEVDIFGVDDIKYDVQFGDGSVAFIRKDNVTIVSVNEDKYVGGGRITKYVQLYFVQGNYGQGWEDLTAHDNRKDARAEMRVYDDNESYPHRVIQRRVLRTDYEKGKYVGGGEVDILKLYQKDTFSDKDLELIEEAIENGGIDTTDIKEDFMGYVYDRIDKEYKDEFETEDIWEYTDDQYENLLTHKENYQKLIAYLKDDEEYVGGGEITDADLNYYIYPTKEVKIAYLGKIQMGYFFSLKDALKEIEYLTMAYPKNEIEKYAIITPDKTFHLGEKEYNIRFDNGGEAGGGLPKKRRRSASVQYGRSDTAVDKTRVAKPVGYRFTNAKANELRKDPYDKPTEAEVKKYLGKGIYKENRKRHSDRDRNVKL